jgi:hypothetical protein
MQAAAEGDSKSRAMECTVPTEGAPDRTQFNFVRRSRLSKNVTEDAQLTPAGTVEASAMFKVSDPANPTQESMAQMVTFK